MFDWLRDLAGWADDAARHAAIQLDPVAASVAVAALIYSIRANRRARRIEKRERDLAGQIDRVEIGSHWFQDRLDRSRSRTKSPTKETGQPEFFRCSVYSGATEVDVDGVALSIDFTEGWLGQNRIRVNVDLRKGEGMARRFPELPRRMPPHSRLDWDLTEFLTFFPSRRADERVLGGTSRILTPNEQLRFRFIAYSRVTPTPHTSIQERRLPFFGLPLRGGRRSPAKVYESAWDAVMDESAPASLAAWLLPWVERRDDFPIRLMGDDSGRFMQRILEIKQKHYWPPGLEKEGHRLFPVLADVHRRGIPGARLVALEAALTTLADGTANGSPSQPTEIDRAATTLRRLHLLAQRRNLTKKELAEYGRTRAVLCLEIATILTIETHDADEYMDFVVLPQVSGEHEQ